jgi:1-phosphatidylinositol phosphodiesterase
MRRATTFKEDPSRPLAVYEDDEEWNYLYDEPTTPTASTSTATEALEIHTHIPKAATAFAKIPLTSWLTHLPSSSPLSTLSIPGTHNSCARIPVPWVACQSATLTQQLHLGIRYFDFRLGIAFGSLRLYHGKTPLRITFKEALGELYAFLREEKRECLVLQVKHEGGDRDDEGFEKLFRGELAGNKMFWAVGNLIPTLGEVRGKIQLMRRFRVKEPGAVLGIDVLRWADNAKRFWIPVPPGYGHLMVQDEYKFTNVVRTFKQLVERKGADIQDLILEAQSMDTEVRRCGWYLNWCNAFAEPFSFGVVATPEQIALGKSGEVGINEVVRDRIGRARGGGERVRVGTILLDFVDVGDPRVVQEVVMCNQFWDE